jgi:hypothetical protein
MVAGGATKLFFCIVQIWDGVAATAQNRLSRDASVLAAFGQCHEKELRALRNMTIQRAALAALGGAAEARLHQMGLPHDERRYWLARRSDPDRVELLRNLDAISQVAAPAQTTGSGDADNC